MSVVAGPVAAEEVALPAAGTAPSRLAAVVLAMSCGLLVVAVSFAAARDGRAWAEPAFWTGLAILFAAPTLTLLGSRATAAERGWILVAFGVLLYGVKLLHSPELFTFHDELGFLRSTDDLIRSGELYTFNPLVRAYAYYPGLSSAVAAISQLTGLGVYTSASILIGVIRAVLIVGLFGFLTRVAGSARAASIAVLIYAANPNFLFFDAQFAYESLAIGLVAACLLAVATASTMTGAARISLAVAAIGIGAATVMTHHLTSYALAVALWLWAIVDWRYRGAVRPSVAGCVAIAVTAAVGGWSLFAGDATGSDIGPALTGATSGLIDILTGSSSGRAPFGGASGYVDPPLERAAGLASVALLLAALPVGLWRTWRLRRTHPALLLLAAAAAAYPASLALRLTTAGTETSNRASEFVFTGLGATIALLLTHRVLDRGRRVRRVVTRIVAAGLVTVVFLGGLIVGWPPYARLPGGYLVGGGPRSVDGPSLAAARWAGGHLPPNSRMLADGSNKGLMVAYGNQDPQGGAIGGVPVGTLFVAPTFTEQDKRIIVDDALRFIVVDRRLSSALPRDGRYFDSGDTEGPKGSSRQRPLDPRALSKFDAVPRLQKVYANGPIAIYDARGLLRAEGRVVLG